MWYIKMRYKIVVMARNSTGRGLFLILILQPFFSLATLARSGWRYCQQMRRVKQPAKLRADSAILSWWTILEYFMMMERCSDNLEIRMDLAFWLLLSWMVVLVCLAKGIRTSGKVFQVPLNLIFPLLCPLPTMPISMSRPIPRWFTSLPPSPTSFYSSCW